MSDILLQITQLAERQRALARALVLNEELLKATKEALRQVQENDLPMAMAEAGITAFTLEDGTGIVIEDVLSASIPSASTIASTRDRAAAEAMARRRSDAFAWLDEHGFGDLIKTEVSTQFGRGELEEAKEIADFLQSQGLQAEVTQGVHAGTLKAWVREQLAQGTNVPHELFGIYEATKAVIKESKNG